jgi:hypothetical protein
MNRKAAVAGASTALAYGAFLVAIIVGPWWFWKWVIVGLCFALGMAVVGFGTYWAVKDKN